MQAIEYDGTEWMPEVFDKDRIEKLLEDQRVKEVRVFKLVKGMDINVAGVVYKVIAIRPNGKITLKPKKNELNSDCAGIYRKLEASV